MVSSDRSMHFMIRVLLVSKEELWASATTSHFVLSRLEVTTVCLLSAARATSLSCIFPKTYLSLSPMSTSITNGPRRVLVLKQTF
jgi:hypothetical protein